MTEQELLGYEAAYERAAYFPQTQVGYLSIGGEDRIDFIQRQTTNDLNKLQPGYAMLSVLTSAAARILDVFYLLKEEDSIGVITLSGRGPETANFLKGRIFFNDKVTLHDFSDQIIQIDLIGPQAGELLEKLSTPRIPETGEIVPGKLEDHDLRIFAHEPSLGMGYRILAPAEAVQTLEDMLLQAGADRLSVRTYLVLRVESGLPEAGYELTDLYTPLENRLEAAIAEGKGCYTGQEVIARQITYDKVTQRLCGLRLENTVNADVPVWVEGRSIGTITSTAQSPRFGPIALGILKRPHFNPGTAVIAGPNAEEGVRAVVAELPFKEVGDA